MEKLREMRRHLGRIRDYNPYLNQLYIRMDRLVRDYNHLSEVD